MYLLRLTCDSRRYGRLAWHSARISAVVAMTIAASSLCDAQLVRTGAGVDTAAIQAVVDQYRSDLGTLNPNVVGSVGSGRREINWDGVPDAFSAPNNLPANFFNSNSPRGAVFGTPGTSVQVSADNDNPTSTAVRFGNINPTYVDTFRTFSPQRLFSPIGSNIVDVTFFVPGSGVPAVTRGFGAVYTDVDNDNNTAFEFFDATGQSLGSFTSPVLSGGMSFLGISYAESIVARVRIEYGNSALGPDDGNGIDVAVMDDFIYGEPVTVPEPTLPSLGILLIVGMVANLRRASP